MEDVLQPGHRQVAAGYILFGSSMMFVYSTGHGVHGFTLDPSVGEFLLSHENIRIPDKGSIYSTNEGYFERWKPEVQRYVQYLKKEDEASGRPYSFAIPVLLWLMSIARCFTVASTSIRVTQRTRMENCG